VLTTFVVLTFTLYILPYNWYTNRFFAYSVEPLQSGGDAPKLWRQPKSVLYAPESREVQMLPKRIKRVPRPPRPPPAPILPSAVRPSEVTTEPGPELAAEGAAIFGKLPSDILFLVFEFYGLLETGSHPLETLLLVCKSWADIAQNYSRLWSTFRLYLGDTENMKLWRNRVHRRLERCSSTSLFDIQIRNDPKYEDGIGDVKLFNQILYLLMGYTGILLRRWCVFRTDHSLNTESDLDICLSFPTPNLVEIEVEGLDSTRPVLPVAPLLRVFRGFHNRMTCPPDLSTVTELEIDPNDWGKKGLTGAKNVVTLKTNPFYHVPYSLPGTFPKLTTLSLSWLSLEDGRGGAMYKELGDLEVPALKRLSICAASGTDLVLVTRCRGIPLLLLEEVQISSRDRIIHGYRPVEFFRDCMLGFLTTLTSLKVLELDGPLVSSLGVKLLLENCQDAFLKTILRVKAQQKEVEVLPGEDWVADLKELRRTCKIAHGTWNEIYEDLDWVASHD